MVGLSGERSGGGACLGGLGVLSGEPFLTFCIVRGAGDIPS
jgi:hypothetical protein